MVSEEELKTERLADNKPPHSNRRLPATVWIGTGVTIIALVAVALKYSPHAKAKPAGTTPASLPHVAVSMPLVENLDTTSKLPRPILGCLTSRNTRSGGGRSYRHIFQRRRRRA